MRLMQPPHNHVAPQADWNASGLISALGRSSFEPELATILMGMCQSDHLHIFQLSADGPAVLTALSRNGSSAARNMAEVYNAQGFRENDPDFLRNARQNYPCPTIDIMEVRTPSSSLMADYYRTFGIAERVIIWGELGPRTIGLSLIRGRQSGAISPAQTSMRDHLVNTIFPIVLRHLELRETSAMVEAASGSANDIERALARIGPPLSVRERQVLAGAIAGMPAKVISDEMGISEDAVVCYRKRAFEKISVTTIHGLLKWYFEACCRLGFDEGNRDLRTPDGFGQGRGLQQLTNLN